MHLFFLYSPFPFFAAFSPLGSVLEFSGCENLLTSESLLEPRLGLCVCFPQSDFMLLWTSSALCGEMAGIGTPAAAVRDAGKRGAPRGGPDTMCRLISYVTFKLLLEAA